MKVNKDEILELYSNCILVSVEGLDTPYRSGMI